MTQSLLPSALLSLAERTINHSLHYDPATQMRLAALETRVLRVHMQSPSLHFLLIPHSQGLSLIPAALEDGIQADCEIKGESSAFLKLARTKAGGAMMPPGIKISGDLELAHQVNSILANIDLDWEGLIATWIGDIAAHQVSLQAKALFHWGQNAFNQFAGQVEEFVQEESRTLPPQLEVNGFYRDVEELELQLDRLTARIERLQNDISEGGTATHQEAMQ